MQPYIGKRVSKELFDFLNFYKENYSGEELLLAINQVEFAQRDDKVYSGKKAKSEPVFINGRKEFSRNRATAINALSNASYRCEIDGAHKTFIRKNNNIPYTEPHHLVPMKDAGEFLTSLDIEENIVSLCSTCHNQIHYGKGCEDMLNTLFLERKDLLKSAGIDITEVQLLDRYRTENY